MSYTTRSAILAITLLAAPAARAESTTTHGVTFDARSGVSSTTGGVVVGPLLGVGLGARTNHVSGAAFAEMVAGTPGTSGSLGVGVGPSIEVAGHDLELLGTVGRNHYHVGHMFGVGSSADSTFVGARLGVSRAPVPGTRVLYGFHAFYGRDLTITEGRYSTGAFWSEGATMKTATMGGHTVGFYVRLGGVAGF